MKPKVVSQVVVLAVLSLARCGAETVGEARAEEGCPASGQPAAEEQGGDRADVVKEPPWKKYWKKLPQGLRTLLDHVDDAGARLTDVKADVQYSREIPLLEEEEHAAGSLVFKKPNMIVLKLGEPRNEDVYTDGKLWWIVNHRDKQVEIYEATASEEVSQEAAFLKFGIGESARRLLSDYKIELAGKRQEKTKEKGPDPNTAREKVITWYRLRFEPRHKEAPKRYKTIEVEFSDALWLPQVIVLHESGGEIIHTFRLTHPKLNTGVKDKDFKCKLPPGYVPFRP